MLLNENKNIGNMRLKLNLIKIEYKFLDSFYKLKMKELGN